MWYRWIIGDHCNDNSSGGIGIGIVDYGSKGSGSIRIIRIASICFVVPVIFSSLMIIINISGVIIGTLIIIGISGW